MNTKPPPSPWRLIAVLVGGIAAIYALGSLTGALLYLLGEGRGDGLEHFLLRKGPDRLMRRGCLLWALILLPWFLKELRWRGWSDFGFFPADGRWNGASARRQLLRGFAVGLLTLGGIACLHYLAGLRIVDKPKPLDEYLIRALRVTVQALTVGVIEETAMRGILFRTLARSWKPWIAAVALSVLFAALHFVAPDPAVYAPDKGVWALTWQPLLTLHHGYTVEPLVGIQFLNLTLMGLVMTALVIRTRTIWWAAGVHAGWVWVKLMSGYATNEDFVFGQHHPFLGWRHDATDGWLASCLLVVMLLNIVYWPRNAAK